ncbi:MAG TPA: hypothetical protein VH089_01650 [Streptosporangiaceae bacterium]|nr:hypothetical protein [Streptosporangiaceae bacterium]
MTRGRKLALALASALTLALTVMTGGASALAGTGGPWGTAIEVPGIDPLNTSFGWLSSISCPAVGDCTAGGSYSDSSGHDQAYVVGEAGGTWGTAIQVPGTAALDVGDGGDSTVSVSCSSSGNCAAGGDYTVSSGYNRPFVADETNGVWGTAIEVPGADALVTGRDATVSAVSCVPGPALDCAVAGSYQDAAEHGQAFVADAVNGVWGTAIEVPGTPGLGSSAGASVLSCPATGACTVGGTYADSAGNFQPFVAREGGGTWGPAVRIPGAAALNQGPNAQVNALSCTSAGNCSVTGTYGANSSGSQTQLYVDTEKNGAWGTAVAMPGLAALNTGLIAQAYTLSCTSAGNCAAGGYYTDSTGGEQAFVISQTGGTWGSAIEVPGSAALNLAGNGGIRSVSCASSGNCVAGGYFAKFHTGHTQALVVDETAGVWRKAQEVPGTAALNTGNQGQVNAVSCVRAATCALGGIYNEAGTFLVEPFVSTQG